MVIVIFCQAFNRFTMITATICCFLMQWRKISRMIGGGVGGRKEGERSWMGERGGGGGVRVGEGTKGSCYLATKLGGCKRKIFIVNPPTQTNLRPISFFLIMLPGSIRKHI